LQDTVYFKPKLRSTLGL